MEATQRVFNHTQALCPVCKGKVQARVIEQEDRVFLEKFCPQHGMSKVLISSDARWYADSQRYVKPRQIPLDLNVQEFRGCPESCGFCPQHQQHTCLPVIEITSECNLDCPVCLKDLRHKFRMSREEFAGIVDMLIRCEGRVDVLNISGGEPSTHPELIDFLHIARDKGVTQMTVSTNGLAFLKSPRFCQQFRESGAIAALQFDGFKPSTYEILRGKNLAEEKLRIISLLEAEGIRYSLVATLANGVNAGDGHDEIVELVDFFFDSRAVSLMFQPIALTGEAVRFSAAARLTVPDVVHAIERSARVKKGDFNPLPCSHFSCFALAYYFILGDNRYLSLKEFLGDESYLELIANKTLPGLDGKGFEAIRNRLCDVWSLADAGSLGEQALQRIQDVLREASRCDLTPQKIFSLGAESMKGIFIHDLMDADTLDFGRLIKCCNPYPQVDGRLIPMCAQNVSFRGRVGCCGRGLRHENALFILPKAMPEGFLKLSHPHPSPLPPTGEGVLGRSPPRSKLAPHSLSRGRERGRGEGGTGCHGECPLHANEMCSCQMCQRHRYSRE